MAAARTMLSSHILLSWLTFVQNPSLIRRRTATTSSIVRLLFPSFSSSAVVAQPNNNKLKKRIAADTHYYYYSIFHPSPTQFNRRFGYSSSSSSSAYFCTSSNTNTNTNTGDCDCDWLPRERVKKLFDVLPQMRECQRAGYGDKKHWWFITGGSSLSFTTEQSLYDFYVDIFARAIQSSREEAKKKIYLVFCEEPLGFGAEVDGDTLVNVQDFSEHVYEDCSYDARNNDPSVQLNARFVPKNKNNRVDDIYRYQVLSERNPKWNDDHWIISVRTQCLYLPDIAHYVDLLTKIVGSKKEAKKKIYMAWLSDPAGFAAEIDRDTANKLKALSDVVIVIPDYSFDLKDLDQGVLVIFGKPNSPHYRFFDHAEKVLGWGEDSD